MTGLKILSAAAAATLVLAMAVPTASFAEPQGGRAGVRAGGGGGGGFRAGGGGVRPGGAVAPMARYGGGGGVYHGGYRDGHRGGGFIPGAVAGVVIGGALAAGSYAYDGGPGYYDNQYYDDGTAAVVQGAGDGIDEQVAYCMQTYRSYDLRSGTYLAFDGVRRSCP